MNAKRLSYNLKFDGFAVKFYCTDFLQQHVKHIIYQNVHIQTEPGKQPNFQMRNLQNQHQLY